MKSIRIVLKGITLSSFHFFHYPNITSHITPIILIIVIVIIVIIIIIIIIVRYKSPI